MNINLTATQLRRAADIKDQIEKLERAFEGIINGHIPVQSTNPDDGWPGLVKQKFTRWTPERRAKFRRTMRRKAMKTKVRVGKGA